MSERKLARHFLRPRFLRWVLLFLVVLAFGSLQLGASLLRGRLGCPLWVSVFCGAGSFVLPLAWLVFASGLNGSVRLVGQVLIVLAAVGALRHYPLKDPMAVGPGFRFSLFAEQPLVLHPVAVAVDNWNRLFVVETHCHFDAFSPSYDDEELAARTAQDAHRLW